MKRKILSAFCLSAAILAAVLPASAEQRTVNYQGRLSNADGTPVVGTKAMEFAFFDVLTGGKPLEDFSEAQSVEVVNGIFNVLIGSETTPDGVPVSIFNEYETVYLGVMIDRVELMPRKLITWAPKAMVAEVAGYAADADKLDGYNSTQFAAAAHSHTLAQIASDADVLEAVKRVDGSGSGLDADRLDGQDSTAFSPAAHNHDSRYVNLTGDIMTGHLTMSGNNVVNVGTITGYGGTLQISNSAAVNSSLDVGWDATIARILQVAPSGIGGVKVGVLERFIANEDIGVGGSLRADSSLYLGSSKSHGNIYSEDTAGNEVLKFDANAGSLAIGSENQAGSINLKNSSGTATVSAYGHSGNISATGKITAERGVEGTGVTGANYLPPLAPVPAVPGVRGVGTAGGAITPGAAGVEAVGGGGVLIGSADIALRTLGGLFFLDHDSYGLYMVPGDGSSDPAMNVRRYGSTGTSQPLMAFNGNVRMANANDRLQFMTASGSIWSLYGNSTADSKRLSVIGPSNGELYMDAANGTILLGGYSDVTVKIPGVIDGGINVKRDASGGVSASAVRSENTNANGIAVYGLVDSTDTCSVFVNKGTGDLIRGFSGPTGGALVFQVTNAGRVICNELQITGGADLAEPFDTTTPEAEPGMVMSIDPDRTGSLRIAGKAYDRAVAGIVSGANGIKPGVTMRQQDTPADGTLPIALTGRVYCWADASYGAIEPGDTLTTSNTPGHAMKATDFSRAQGATIGKAMSSLPEGRGLVLVLVNLH